MLPTPACLLLPDGLQLACYDSGIPGPTLLLLSGNSLSARATYGALWAEPALAGYRRVAFDWPGCGESPREPVWYGPARLTLLLEQAVAALALSDLLVVGHSLGGHLALGTLPQLPNVRGVLLAGTPPLASVADLAVAFHPDPRMGLLYQPDLSEADYAQLLTALLGPAAPPAQQALVAAALRQSDPAFRAQLAAEIGAGNLTNELAILRTTAVPVAVVHGDDDPLVAASYLAQVPIPTRWGPAMHRLPGVGHLPMLEAPEAFARIVAAFAATVFGAEPAGA